MTGEIHHIEIHQMAAGASSGGHSAGASDTPMSPDLLLRFLIARLKKGARAGYELVDHMLYCLSEWLNLLIIIGFGIHLGFVWDYRESKKPIVVDNPVKIKPIKRGK